MSTNYAVTIEPFADRHYIRTFAKKYKRAWDFTLSALVREFQSFDVILEKSITEEITDRNADVVICKTEFKISGTQESRHGSGNRCIVAKHKNTNKVCVLLVYHKNDLGGGNETANWKNVIKENYPEYGNLL
ncbi:MAG: hypothetical protein COV08_03190 [Candidatus Vogelbacteria bacterium CG10_big_fil_rev_8_21_14_0_10_49_38]|uniref:Uncharacterized protein n=1 Tax=Candidatus Vogelbacteria bacterium CG10_big_fil_rev_8_21_14_0_10_49_38 TaxID=1975043 RepID=A0A2H0RH34_9BACT|nr:MAG: hypothetical protein BK006_03195 [bacterium CG10_49_38]PIR45750.1 MAG: hypothetical protein COV08_03190 [Candidatus Vogelbacteria bacterium CG10_big_fil_rev_8_21_14_0_10_49_38]